MKEKAKRVTESNDEAENLIQTNSSVLGSRDNQAPNDVASESHFPNRASVSVTQENKTGRGPSKWKSSSQMESVEKRPRSRKNVDDKINADRCCICFGSCADDAGTAREWLKCHCK